MHYNKKYDGITHTLEDSTMLNSNKNKRHNIFINYSIILLGMRRRAAMVEGKYYLFFFCYENEQRSYIRTSSPLLY